ncbi:MAG: hypothetical protein J0H09_24390 [Burkholderiales bacterium]|nr:hypothetical protein [Burkholderiales bacterium]
MLLALTALAVVGCLGRWFFTRDARYLRWAKLSFVAGIVVLALFFAVLILERTIGLS